VVNVSRIQFHHAVHTGVVDSRRLEGQVGKWWNTRFEEPRRQLLLGRNLNLEMD
jgi:hypothetical protein